MAGYSGTPLTKKLGIKPEATLLLSSAPKGFERLLEPLPLDVTVRRRLGKSADVVVAFFTSRSALVRRLPALIAGLESAGGIWIAWPKKSSGVRTDITENVLREEILPTGLVDNKVCAIDETWSGLRFVRRLENR